MFPAIEFRENFIAPHEGRRYDVYADSLGIWTMAEGFNMEQPGAREICAKCGIDWDECMAEKGTGKHVINDDQCVALYMNTLSSRLPEVRRLMPGFDSFSQNRQMAIMDIAWVGIGTLSKFHNMLAAINSGDWDTAAAELLDSKMAHQWGHRAQQDADILRKG